MAIKFWNGQTVVEIAQQHDMHPNQATEGRRRLIECTAIVAATPPVDVEKL